MLCDRVSVYFKRGLLYNKERSNEVKTMNAYEHAEAIIKESSKSFYKAFSNLPEDKAKAVYAIYGFCRTADDAVDIFQNEDKIDELRTGIKATFDGKAPDDLLFEALSDTLSKYPSELSPYLDLLEGLEGDLKQRTVETEEEFDRYCYNVASTVGLMLLPVIAKDALKKDAEKVKHVAIELGKAMQITNILRDVKEDLMGQRVYFPESLLKKHNVLVKTMRVGTVTPEYRSLVEYYIDMANEKYQVFYDHVDLFDKDAIKPTYYAAKFYQAILDEIRKNGYNNLTKRHYVSKFRKWRLMREAAKELRGKGL